MTQLLWKTAAAFFTKMVAKLIHQNSTHGYIGWDQESSVRYQGLMDKLHRNIKDEDWVDVANLAMMLDYRKSKESK